MRYSFFDPDYPFPRRVHYVTGEILTQSKTWRKHKQFVVRGISVQAESLLLASRIATHNEWKGKAWN